LKRPAEFISLSKNSRRHGAGKESVSSLCTASRQTAKDLFGLGQPHVDRRDVRVLGELSRLRDGTRAPRARRGRVAGAQKPGDGQAAGRLGQMRRYHLPPVLEFGDVKLAAPRVVDDRGPPRRRRNRLVRRHRADRLPQRQRQALHRGQPDAHAGERAGAARDGEEVDLAAIDAGLAQEPVDGREQLLVARALAFQRGGGQQVVVAQQGDG
jgi:hypothetical protein